MKCLVTGGAGFIGCNAVKRLISEGHQVVVFDNLSRMGTDVNLKWLKERYDFEFVKGDVRDFEHVGQVFRDHSDIEAVLHLAAQVAVTTSVKNPREDFDINALGTFNLLEAVRNLSPMALFLNASTNKVYGKMEDVEIVEQDNVYKYAGYPNGISEGRLLEFHSPYGCSKGAAEQYVIDYSRIYDMKTVSFRQSCIYGPHQFGIEDQGWVAWFTICAALDKPITIYGDGKQVRDVLFIDDLLDCYIKAAQNIGRVNGGAYNIGGSAKNTLSLFQLISLLEHLLGKKIQYKFDEWRPGDQKVFICNTGKAEKDFGWKPETGVEKGVEKLLGWVLENKELYR